jgi:hypothetical protein
VIWIILLATAFILCAALFSNYRRDEQACELVFSLLRISPTDGRRLRELLRDAGYKYSVPEFYRFMSGLEEKKLVEARNEETESCGRKITQRWYRSLV